MCERERARPGRASGTRLGRGWLDATRSGVGWGGIFVGAGVHVCKPLGVCIRGSTWRDVRVSPSCVCAALRVALRARVAQRLAPRCSSVGLCVVGGGGGAGTHVSECPRVCACVHTCRRVCTTVSRRTCFCLHTRVPVGTCVHLCVSVCTWISMRVSTRRAGDFWGHIFEEQRLTPPNLSHSPATWWGPWGKQGAEMPRPQQQRGTLCVRPGLAWGGRGERLSWRPQEPSRAALLRPPPPSGSKILRNDLESSSISLSCPCLLTRKEEEPGSIRWLQAPHATVWAAGA